MINLDFSGVREDSQFSQKAPSGEPSVSNEDAHIDNMLRSDDFYWPLSIPILTRGIFPVSIVRIVWRAMYWYDV